MKWFSDFQRVRLYKNGLEKQFKWGFSNTYGVTFLIIFRSILSLRNKIAQHSSAKNQWEILISISSHKNWPWPLSTEL